MYKIFWNHCKSNWKTNFMTRGVSFLPMLIWLNIWRKDENTGLVGYLMGLLMLVSMIGIITFFDLSVPKTLYICPISYKDRKNYIKKMLHLKLWVSVGFWMIASVVVVLWAGFIETQSWYCVVMQGAFLLMVLWTNSMDCIIPGMGVDANSDNYTRMAKIIGWREVSYKLIFEIAAIFMIIASWYVEPGLDFINVVQWVILAAGALLIRRFYREHLNLFLSIAADYEFYMKYQKPIKK